ncbi:hypothetical protein SKAU_G00108990 [Synaphobranchus kaupii]|uniref:Uncharacterized protein n=1 Tax=Synaphobranchus kaupii TaxID=118154 RepID=A0A9Q1G036_SYNKA|nr:hypothetical protein SKAU_G00108990 [Synaphobranchus kaupii]
MAELSPGIHQHPQNRQLSPKSGFNPGIHQDPQNRQPSPKSGFKIVPMAGSNPQVHYRQQPAPKSVLLKVLLPAQGQNTSICFKVNVHKDVIPKEPVFKLLHDPATGVSINGEAVQRGSFLKIGVHKDECHIKANTTGIMKCKHLSQEPKGLLGRSPVSYVIKETSPLVKLEILGKVVLATRVSAVDYSTHVKPTVDCWLVPFSSVVPEHHNDSPCVRPQLSNWLKPM